jgi:hypothetical protein
MKYCTLHRIYITRLYVYCCTVVYVLQHFSLSSAHNRKYTVHEN